VYEAEKQAQMPGAGQAERATVEEAVRRVRDAMQSEDSARILQAVEALSAAVAALSAASMQNAASGQSANGASGDQQSREQEENVVDAEFSDVDEGRP
ncbi:hypothetical protein, partial [Rhodomicrobium sp. R_RK_3]|uniref:hypothetical protein n=1 Tax=Rhodomicrobium sp. R_RK_3 TaxID=2029567 RepID=UPI001FD97D56